jgi:Rieske Fe-S protein
MDELYLPPLDPQKGSWDETAISRRRFLEIGFWTVTGAAGLTVGGTGARFLVGDALEPKPEQWVQVGVIAELPAGQVHRTTYTTRIFDAWRETEETGLLYCFSQDGNEYTVLDATCSHLGCNVLWQEYEGHFACPCHNGVFDQEGRVISGPPPTPLRRLQTKIENGVLMALI